MRSLKRGEKVNAPLAEGCGRSSARSLKEGARHGGHRGRAPGVPVPLRGGSRLLPPKGTSPTDLGSASPAESLNCSRLHLVVTGPNPQGSGLSLLVPLQSACCSWVVQGEGGGGFPQRLLSGMCGGRRAGHHVHTPPSSGRGCRLRVASQGGLSSSAFWFISQF